MSNKLRNPFMMRASEKIESDASFLRLYSPIVLDALLEKEQSGKLWENILFIHSSPGAGKTSLLRVFEPGSLTTLLNNKSAADYRELFAALKKLGVINDEKIELLGVTLPCTRNYSILEELDVSTAQKSRFFFALLNARLILATLRNILALTQNSYPNGLDNISFNYDNQDNYFANLKLPCSGTELYTWASNIENKIYATIDSLLPVADASPEGHSELFALTVLKPEYFLVNGNQICNRFLFMLDDTHKLSGSQRTALKKYVLEKRSSFSIWIAERLEALESQENLRSTVGRDYEEVNLEKVWGERPSKFEKILGNIANRRASISTEDVNSFQEYLENDFSEEVYKVDLKAAVKSSYQTITKLTAHTPKFREWIEYIDNYQGSLLEKAILIKKIEILIHRNIGRDQLSFEFPLNVIELEEKLKSDIENAAKLFLSRENKLPYYYGFQTLVKLSSNNIEQFLSFAADLFEDMISNRLAGENVVVSLQSQEKIMRNVVDRKWHDLRRLVPYSKEVIKFLNELGSYFQKETFKANAPYAPGVNGFAIKVKQPTLIQRSPWYEDEHFQTLIDVVATCVAFNLLEVKEIGQGERGQKWDVYYLNRWLCVKYNLPLSYGGWKHKSPDELLKWTKV